MAKAEKPKPKGKKNPVKDDLTQAERFKETARQLGVDETGRLFEDSFRRIVPPKKAGPR
jgi:hypothetical protein